MTKIKLIPSQLAKIIKISDKNRNFAVPLQDDGFIQTICLILCF